MRGIAGLGMLTESVIQTHEAGKRAEERRQKDEYLAQQLFKHYDDGYERSCFSHQEREELLLSLIIEKLDEISLKLDK